MKQILFTMMAALLLISCNTAGKYKIVVTFPDDTANGQTAYLTSYDTGDTLGMAEVNNACAILEGEEDGSYMARLLVDGKRMGFVVEKGEIAILWQDRKATGTPLNDRLNELNDEIDAIEASADSTGADAEQLVMERFHKAYEENMDNGIGPWAFNYYLMYNSFTEAQLDSVLATARDLKRVKKAINAAHQLVVTAVGQPFTDFANEAGEKLSDHVGKGKWALVDFWASWCGPCRREIANLKTLYPQYKDKVNFVGVAVWDKTADTQKDIEDLGITWPVIENGQNWTEPTDLYGISGIPHIMLVDPEGKIVARGLHGDEIAEALKKAL